MARNESRRYIDDFFPRAREGRREGEAKAAKEDAEGSARSALAQSRLVADRPANVDSDEMSARRCKPAALIVII